MTIERGILAAPLQVKQGKLDKASRLLFGRGSVELPSLIPGVLLAATIVVLSIVTADLVNSALGFKSLLGYITLAILFGLVIGNAFPKTATTAPGIAFCIKSLLRLGIVLMGLKLSVVDAARIGAWGIPIVLVCILVGLVTTTYLGRLFKLPARLGTLISIGTSICGTTAIVAAAPAIDATEEEVSYAVATITTFGISAMLVYPYLSHWLFGGDSTMAGLFLGTSIHETAQVAGAGLIYDQAFQSPASTGAANAAIVMKLVRNLLMALVIPAMAFIYHRRASHTETNPTARVSIVRLFPVFILGFAAMAILRSIGDASLRDGAQAFGLWNMDAWSSIVSNTSTVATWSLAMAMAGVGLSTRISTLRRLGLKPFYLGLVSASAVGVASAIAVFLLGTHL